jgi:hypothetical protein
MRLLKLALVTGLFAGAVFFPATLEAARPGPGRVASDAAPRAQKFTACPLPIPNCLPEYVFDFKQCRCVPRP